MRAKLGVAAAATVALWSTAASAVSMSMNWLEFGTLSSVDACMAAGEDAFEQIGLRLLSRTESAAWAESPRTEELYTVYCIQDRQIIVVVGAGDDLDIIDEMVTRILETMIGSDGPK
ncbi:MAG: hypothetical protein KDA49_02560 [Rhodospirillaceae bacterium]|nr:hypothetical protein [Rhodospirillaceae bacterium]MCA8931318.1 hypothetical protein [Rhodospirillaceae bacterium]